MEMSGDFGRDKNDSGRKGASDRIDAEAFEGALDTETAERLERLQQKYLELLQRSPEDFPVELIVGIHTRLTDVWAVAAEAPHLLMVSEDDFSRIEDVFAVVQFGLENGVKHRLTWRIALANAERFALLVRRIDELLGALQDKDDLLAGSGGETHRMTVRMVMEEMQKMQAELTTLMLRKMIGRRGMDGLHQIRTKLDEIGRRFGKRG
jgi:hypothetical protein